MTAALETPHIPGLFGPEKTCTKCGTTKPLDEFHVNRAGPDGRRPDCRECRNAYTLALMRRKRAQKYQGYEHRMVTTYPGIYRSLSAHKSLSTNPNVPQYHNYGGRGIEYRFAGTFEDGCKLVVETLGHRPTKKHSLDRIDVDGHFEINNLRWATRRQQADNRRPRPTASEWATICEQIPAAQELLSDLRSFGSPFRPERSSSWCAARR